MEVLVEKLSPEEAKRCIGDSRSRLIAFKVGNFELEAHIASQRELRQAKDDNAQLLKLLRERDDEIKRVKSTGEDQPMANDAETSHSNANNMNDEGVNDAVVSENSPRRFGDFALSPHLMEQRSELRGKLTLGVMKDLETNLRQLADADIQAELAQAFDAERRTELTQVIDSELRAARASVIDQELRNERIDAIVDEIREELGPIIMQQLREASVENIRSQIKAEVHAEECSRAPMELG